MSSESWYSYDTLPAGPGQPPDWRQTALPVAVTICLLVFGLANVASRATSHDVEDGVL